MVNRLRRAHTCSNARRGTPAARFCGQWPRAFLLLFIAALLPRALQAQSGGYVFTAVCPASPGTPGEGCEAYGINSSGQIVGYEGGAGWAGFLYSGGTLSQLSFAAQGINDTGEIVGSTVVDIAGSLSSISYPGAAQTSASDVNGAGEIVGYYTDSSGNYHGFLDVGGAFTSIDFPGAVWTFAEGINSAGQIVGYYFNAKTNAPSYGFLYSAGNFTTVAYPGAFATAAYGINDSGEISGWWNAGLGSAHHGFADIGGTFTSLDFPGTPTTTVYGINNAGAVVGYSVFQSGEPPFGFLAVPTTTVSVAPTTVNFGDQLVGTTSTSQGVTITNTGTTVLYLTSVTANGDFAAQLGTCDTPVPVASSCTVSVTFTPASTGTRTGTLTIADNANPQTQSVSLAGTGTAPAASLSTSSLTFANQPLGTTSTSQVVTLTNSGSAALTVDSVAISGDFAESNTCGASVAASTNCEIKVTFTPTAIGTRSGSITISDNASNSPQAVALSGTGTGPAVSLSPGSLTFPAQVSGTSGNSQNVTLSNTGNTSLTISNIAASGDFSQTNTCGSSVSAGANCTISVTFKPTAGGTRTGSVTVSDNASNSPQTVALSGTGQDFTISLASGSSNTTTVSPGQAAAFTLSLTGQGGLNQTVSLTCAGAPSESTCAVSPNMVTPGASATSLTVTVTTTARTIVPPGFGPSLPGLPSRPVPTIIAVLLTTLIVGAWTACRKRRNTEGTRGFGLAALATTSLLTLVLAGCGGGGAGGGGGGNPGTPPGTYSLTVTGSVGSGSSALTHNVTLTLTVN